MGSGLRFEEGVAHAPALTSIIRAAARGGIKRRRHLDERAPA